MDAPTKNKSEPKFTKGEKCIFAHLIITFSLILLISIIYLIHLYLVDHDIREVFITRRSVGFENDYSELDTVPIGQLLINATPVYICNVMLLTPQWSVGPGHCIAMRSEPDLSFLLYAWRIKYKHNQDVTIKRSIVHPHFNRDTFANNIGLVQHVTIRGLQEYKIGKLDQKIYNEYNNDLVLVSWNDEKLSQKDESIEVYPIQLMSEEKCSFYMTPIIELRNYEFCTTFENKMTTILSHGSLIVNKKISHVIGFFTWGERYERSLPLVILNLTNFQEWLKIITL